MGRKELLGLGLIAAVEAGCGGEEPKHFTQPALPLEITTQRDAIIDASFNCGTSLDGDKKTVTEVYNTGLVGDQPTAIYGQACGPEYTREGKPVFGANVDGNRTQDVTDADGNVTGQTHTPVKYQVITPRFFNINNTPCERATALATLDLCAARGDCNATDGPTSPYLPYEVQDHAKHFQSVCERLKDGVITGHGLVFEGTTVDKPLGKEYTGTVKYKDGGTVEGTFIKENDNFKPVGPATITWPSGLSLKISPDWKDSTEEDAIYQMAGEAPLTLTGDPTLSDGNWTTDDDPSDFTVVTYKYDWETRAFTPDERALPNPNGVEFHNVTDAELATYTGYGRYTNFDAASKLTGYEGYWDGGKFEGQGTLRTRSNQTIQAAFTSGKPDAGYPLKFKTTSEAGPLKPLLALPDATGWVVSNTTSSEWDKYVWDDTEKKLVVVKMVNP